MPLISAVLLAAAVAAPQVAPAGTPSSPYQLNGEQVRQCAALKLDQKQRVAELTRREQEVVAEQTTLAARQAELSAMTAKVDTKKKKEVAAFNLATAEFNAALPAHQAKVAALKAYSAEIDPIVATYNRDCAHKSMNPADVAALPEEERALVSAGATTSTVMVPAPRPTPKRRPRR